MKTLIVEDDFVCRSLLLRYLAEFGDCDVAVNGEEALSALRTALDRNEPYELVCLDINMPKITGDRVLQILRQEEESRGIHGLSGSKVVMTTGLSDKDNVLGAFRNGCEGYLIKPLDKEKLFEQLNKLDLIR